MALAVRLCSHILDAAPNQASTDKTRNLVSDPARAAGHLKRFAKNLMYSFLRNALIQHSQKLMLCCLI